MRYRSTKESKQLLKSLRKKFKVNTSKVVTIDNYGNKKIKNATVSIFEGHEFKSSLELYTYKRLKDEGITAVYEQLTIQLVSPFKCGFDAYEQVGVTRAFKKGSGAVRPMTYTPDFTDPEFKEFIIECKGFMNDAFPLKLKLMKKLFTDEKWKGTFYMPRNRAQVDEVIKLIKEKRRSNDSA